MDTSAPLNPGTDKTTKAPYFNGWRFMCTFTRFITSFLLFIRCAISKCLYLLQLSVVKQIKNTRLKHQGTQEKTQDAT
jgi:hypothetical protein